MSQRGIQRKTTNRWVRRAKRVWDESGSKCEAEAAKSNTIRCIGRIRREKNATYRSFTSSTAGTRGIKRLCAWKAKFNKKMPLRHEQGPVSRFLWGSLGRTGTLYSLKSINPLTWKLKLLLCLEHGSSSTQSTMLHRHVSLPEQTNQTLVLEWAFCIFLVFSSHCSFYYLPGCNLESHCHREQ